MCIYVPQATPAPLLVHRARDVMLTTTCSGDTVVVFRSCESNNTQPQYLLCTYDEDSTSDGDIIFSALPHISAAGFRCNTR